MTSIYQPSWSKNWVSKLQFDLMGYIQRTESPRDLKFCIFINFFRKKLSPTSESRAVVIDAIKRAVAMRKKEEVSDLVLFFFHSSMATAHGRRKKTKEKLLFSSEKKNVRWGFPSPSLWTLRFFSYDFQIFIFGEKFTSPTRNDDRGGKFSFSKVGLRCLKMVWNT